MRETQRNIQRYKQRLVSLKSKLAATALLFVMSAAMLTTATFAYVVLSTAPEVSNISTTVAGNGNLEIALATSDENGDLTVPAKSAVGDSELPLLQRNITWGNLVNLNDNAYGLQDIVLRPSSLNLSNLKNKPLRAVKYGTDGRVTELDSNYLYTNFDIEKNRFMITENVNYGVRAISNVKYDNLSAESAVGKFVETEKLLSNAQSYYLALVDSDSEYMIAIAGLMGDFGTAKASGIANNALDITKHVTSFYGLMQELNIVYERMMNVYWSLANAQLTNAGKPLISSLEELMSLSESTLEGSSYGLMMDGFDQTKSDMNTLNKWLVELEDEYTTASTGAGTIYYSEIINAVDFMVKIDTATVATVDAPNTTYTISQLAGSTTTAMGMLGKDLIGTINHGAVWRMEQLLGAKMQAENMEISMTVTKEVLGMPITVPVSFNTLIKSSVQTSSFVLPPLIERAGGADSTAGLTAIAGDVYGMVIDFWVRTNADNSYLILEGEKETTQEPLTHNNYYVYEYSYNVEETVPVTPTPTPEEGEEPSDNPESTPTTETVLKTVVEQYFHIPQEQKTETPESADLSTGTFYYIETGDEKVFSEETVTREEFISNLKPVYETVVIGYDGVNRVWEEGVQNPDRSTTQGSGSCFIIYPETPILQQQALNLLAAMGIVFIDEDGTELAQADFKTDIAIEEEGKVIIPIELKNTSDHITDEYGETVYTITELKRAEEKFITAIVYLDGTKLSNADVSSENSINGSLNLQFGSTKALSSMNDSELRYDEITLSASLSATSKKHDSTTPVTLTVDVGEAQPNSVKAIFMRKINETQGVKQSEINLTKESEGTWSAEVPFTTPGNYILRSVWIDGSEYALPEILQLTIEGFEIKNINLQMNGNELGSYTHIMTAESSKTGYVQVDISSDSYSPEDVKVVFGNEDGQFVNTTLNKGSNNQTWSAKVSFGTSGIYTLQYIMVDGEYHPIPAGSEKILSLMLGIQAKIQVSPVAFEYDPTNDEGKVIKITAFLTDDKGNTLTGLTNVELQYLRNNSNIYPKVAILKWDNSRNAYTGEFNVKEPGIYNFASLTISSGTSVNTITKADAQSIAVINPEPPVFESALYAESMIDEYQFAPDKSASITLPFSNADAAQIKATFTHGGKEYTSELAEVVDNSDGIQKFMFKLPTKNSEGSVIEDMTGEWQLTSVSLSNVYIDNILYLPDEENENKRWVTWDLSSQQIKTYVVEKLLVSVVNNDTTVMKEDYFTAYLAQDTYVYSDFDISISDSKQNKSSITSLIESNELDIENPTLTYSFIKNTDYNWWQEYGSTVDGDKATTDAVSPRVEFESTGELTYSNTNNAEFMYPGNYSPELSFKIYDGVNSNTPHEYTIKNIKDTNGNDVATVVSGTNSPIVISMNGNYFKNESVDWIQPSISLVSTTPELNKTFDSWNQGKKVLASNSATVTDDKIILTVYSTLVSHTTEGGCSDGSYATDVVQFKAPEVCIKLIDGGNYSEAKCIIDNVNTRNYRQDPTFTFTSGKTEASAFMGQETGTVKKMSASSVTYSDYMISYGATGQFVSITYNGKTTYSFELPKKLVINYEY